LSVEWSSLSLLAWLLPGLQSGAVIACLFLGLAYIFQFCQSHG
jgi:hypothetical protein